MESSPAGKIGPLEKFFRTPFGGILYVLWVTFVTVFGFILIGQGLIGSFFDYGFLILGDRAEAAGNVLWASIFKSGAVYTTFLGIWIIELLFCFAALFLIYKIFTLFFGNEIYLMIPLVAALLYGSSIFSPGDSAEEFCLPLIASALYSGIKAVRTGSFPNKKDFFFFVSAIWYKHTHAEFKHADIFIK